MHLGAPPTNKPPFTPNPNLKIQIFHIAYCNDRFFAEATNGHVDKYAILHLLLSQLGWIITARIWGTIHTTIVELLQDLQIPNSKSIN